MINVNSPQISSVHRTPQASLTVPKRAFTLIEILVAIVIIAILAGLSMAVMRNARDKATALKCVNNLRQIGAAFSKFSSDNDGMFPAHEDEETNDEVNESVWSAKLVLGKYLPEPTGKADAIFLWSHTHRWGNRTGRRNC